MKKYNKDNLDEVYNTLLSQMIKYIEIIRKEFDSYMPINVKEKLDNIENYNDILQIKDSGQINGYANFRHIIMPLMAIDVLNKLSKIPGYGINKSHKTYTDDTIINNDNNFITYIYHAFVSGMTPLEYYEDLLLHETLHYCGSNGATALQEGLNELLTRIIAKKYGFRTNACAYPKEVKLCYRLMNIFGENIMYQLAFIKGISNQRQYLRDNLGEDEALLYWCINDIVEGEFHSKYYKHIKEFSGFHGVFLKAKLYNKIDYTKAYALINEYEMTHLNHKRINGK